MSNFYHPDSLDSYMCLKPPFMMKVAMIYAIQHMAMIFLVFSPISMGDLSYMKVFLTPQYVASDLTGLLVVIAWALRHPEANDVWRWVWRNGRILLTIGIALNLVLLAIYEVGNLVSAFFWGGREIVTFMSLLLDVMVLLYLWRSKTVLEVFAEFPAPAEKPNSAK
jgi:hypothetical protein